MFSPLAFREKIHKVVKRWNLFCKDDRLLVAVSGGVDSVVLLQVLLRIPPKNRPKIHVAHFNHRLRGKESDREAEFVKKLCRASKVPCVIGKARVWIQTNNIEACARQIRYDFLKKQAQKLKIQKIVTAHHANDQAETFLMRWLQGSGLRGLSGIRFSRSEGEFVFVRPLLLTSRDEIEAYAKFEKIDFCTDSSNSETHFLRNRLRKMLKNLKKENPNIEERAAINAIFLQADQDFLEAIVQDFFAKKAKRENGRVCFSLSSYLQFPQALQFRLLQRMAQGLVSSDYALPAEAILKLDELLKEPDPKHYDLPSSLALNKEKKNFFIYKRT